MKILKKDKIDRKIRNAYKAKQNLSKIQPDFEYDDFIAHLIFSSLFIFLFGLAAFLLEDYNNILFFWAFYSVLESLFFTRSDYRKKLKKHYKLKQKNKSLIDNLEEKKYHLSIDNNYQEYFNELVKLKGSLKLEKINSQLIQNIIEVYREKDKINLPRLKNEDRINQFIDHEVSKSTLIEKQNNQFMEIANN